MTLQWLLFAVAIWLWLFLAGTYYPSERGWFIHWLEDNPSVSFNDSEFDYEGSSLVNEVLSRRMAKHGERKREPEAEAEAESLSDDTS